MSRNRTETKRGRRRLPAVGLLAASIGIAVGLVNGGPRNGSAWGETVKVGPAWEQVGEQQTELSARLATADASSVAAIDVVGWSRHWLEDQAPHLSPSALEQILRVYPEEATGEDHTFPSVAGSVSVIETGLRFTPRYPLPSGTRFQAVVDSHPPSAGNRLHPLWVRIPESQEPRAARVEAVYPSGDLLPANQLKLYIVFSEPMTTWDPYRYLRLIDSETGTPLEGVFHDMRDGLWDSLGRRLTVVFDPGRIKRGLANHERHGMPLTAGRSYRLEVSDAWPDAGGRPLASGLVKPFRVGEADRRAPTPSEWSTNSPAADSREPVVVHFHESMDRALLDHSLEIVDEAGQAILTDVRIGAEERSCELSPRRPWRAGRYRILVDPSLEDLAGNNLQSLFDVDLLENRPQTADATSTTSSAQRAIVFDG